MRALRKHWKLAVIAIFSLSVAMALGIFSLSLSNTFLLLPPAAPAPDRLVMIYSRSPTEAIGQISYPDYQYLRDHNNVFLDIAAAPNSISVNEDKDFNHQDVKVVSRPVSGNYLSVMGIRPYLGRLLSPSDDAGRIKVAMMTYSCWVRTGSDPNIVGKVLASNTIVGVLPREFTGAVYGINGDLLVPLAEDNFPAATRAQRETRRLVLIARLKPGVSKAQAQAEIAGLSAQLAAAYPKVDQDRAAVVTRATLLPPESIPAVELIAAVLMAVVVLVLLIACANVANLLLAVAVGRRQEASIKLALGASRARLIREFLQESAILCGASAIIGYALAAAAMARFASLNVTVPMLGQITFGMHLRLDATVAAFSIGLMLIAIFATGLAPALYASSPDLAQALSGELAVGGTRRNIRRNALVVVQVAVCTLVLVGMGLCQRSLYNLRHIDLGFSERNLLAMLAFPSGDHPSPEQVREKDQAMRERIETLPGVKSVTLASNLPLLGMDTQQVQIPGSEKKTPVGNSIVDRDFFSTFGIQVLAGRTFGSVDRKGSPVVAVINRKLAETFWPGQDPLGRTLLAGNPARKIVVIGVVADGKYLDIDEAQRPFLYYAQSQNDPGWTDVVVRTAGDPKLWLTPVSQTMRELNMMAVNPLTFDSWMDLSLLTERITAGCVAGLSGLGLLLAVIGLYGAISYSVSERRKELGIRVALGAGPGQLLGMILKQTLRIAGAGIAIGLAGGIAATVLLRAQFYGIAAVEWTVLLPVGIAMLAVALSVAYLSARPWLAADPMEAVRHA